jgi:chromosome partitioning protein
MRAAATEMKVWTIANQKGGAGKTTLAINLAVYAEQRGERTLLVDIDPQKSCTIWHQVRGTHKPMVAEVLPENLASVMDMAKKHRISLVIIDTAPHSTKDIVTAVALSDLVICPSQTSILDFAAMGDTAKVLVNCEAMNKATAVLNNVASRSAEEVYKDAVICLSNFGFKVAPVFVRSLRAFVKSLALGQGVNEYEKGENLAAEDIEKLWAYLTILPPASRGPQKNERQRRPTA